MWGTKKNSKGYRDTWVGYKLHIDVADGQIPVSCILTSASLHDSQAAVPLATLSAQRVDNLYDLMDAAYDAVQIREHSRALGHVPLIDINPRRDKALAEELQTETRHLKRLGLLPTTTFSSSPPATSHTEVAASTRWARNASRPARAASTAAPNLASVLSPAAVGGPAAAGGQAPAVATRRGLPPKAGRSPVERFQHPVDLADRRPVRGIARLGRAPVEGVAGADVGADVRQQRVPPARRGEDVQLAHAGGQSAETGRAGARRIAAGNVHGLDIDRVGDRDLGDRFEVRRECGRHLVERIDPAVRAGVAILAGHCSRQRFAIRGAVPGRGGVTSAIGGFEGISGTRRR